MKYRKELHEGLDLIPKAKKAFKKLKTKKGKIDPDFHVAHKEAFQKIDCLDCANCCKTTSPIFRDVDIKRLSKYFRTTPGKFIEEYLKVDHEGDYVLQSAPCPFLNEADNRCSVYEQRPLACREYPHTDRKNMYQILDLTVRNIEVCPAVVSVVESVLNTNLKQK